MAIFHLHAKNIGKGNNRSAVAASAYCSGSKVMEEAIDPITGSRIQIIHNYANKKDVVFSRIFTPREASLWMQDREALWNLIQNRFDTRKNAVYAKEIDIALPVELSLVSNKELLCEFVEEIFVKEGMVADVNIHMDNENNPHAHIMLSTREIIKGEGEDFIFGKKVRYWDSKEFLIYIRRMWAYKLNEYLRMNGFLAEISHLSYLERGIALIPGVKKGSENTIIGVERAKVDLDIKQSNMEKIRNCPELIIDRLRNNKAAFTREEIVRELAKFYSQDGADSMEFMKAIEAVMASSRLCLLNARDIEGRLLYVDKKRFDLEEDFINIVNRLVSDGKGAHNLEVEFYDLEMSKRQNSIDLTDKQKQVALSILNGPNISIVEGLPGSGKTSVMQEVTAQYKQYGYDVIGSSLSSSAASELGSVIRVMSYNTTKLRYELDKYFGKAWELNLSLDYWRKIGLSPKPNIFTAIYRRIIKPLLHEKTVLIIDEATMIDLPEMHYFLSMIEKTGAKLILLGDSRQLSSIGIKGAFEKMREIMPSLSLDETKRQINIEYRQATKYLSEYKISDAIEIYKNMGNFIFKDNVSDSEAELARDFIAKYINSKGKSVIALAYTNNSIVRLNDLIRENLKEYGEIESKEVTFNALRNGEVRNIFFAIGDRVVFCKNDKYLDLYNGDRGQVIGFSRSADGSRDTIIVKLDRDKIFLGAKIDFKVEIDNFYYQSMDHGFAVNIYKVQGRSYDFVYALMDNYIRYHSFNVMATRHREDIKIYVPDDMLENILYHKIGFNKDVIKAKLDIKAEVNDKRYAAIFAMITKRDNRSFGKDYSNLFHDKTANFVSEYIEVRNETIKLRTLLYEVGGDKEWNRAELKLALSKRSKFAEEILNNYEKYSVILSQTGINYDTIEKHAGRNIYQYFFENKNTGNYIDSAEINVLNTEFSELQKCEIGAIFNHGIKARSLVIKLHNISKKILSEFEESKLNIEKIKIERDLAIQEKKRAQSYISKGREYIAYAFPSFLEKIYITPSEEILAKWENIIIDHENLENALSIIKNKPQIIGELNGFGIGNIIGFSNKRLVAIANFRILEERFRLYEEYKEKIPYIQNKIDNGKYDNLPTELSIEIKLEESKLPKYKLEEFIKEICIRSNISSAYNEKNAINSMILWAKKQSFMPSSIVSVKAPKDYIVFSFKEVSNRLSSNHIEGIFRDYIDLINPDSNIEKKSSRIKAGSLEMNLENGLWHRFSTNKGGNIFGFIKEATNSSITEALEIVANYTGSSKKYSPNLPKSINLKPNKDLWKPYINFPKTAPNFDPNKHMNFMLKENNIDNIYSYRNLEGEIIGYTVRIIHKSTKAKQVIPVSYCHNEHLKKSDWRLKAFTDGNGYKPIYGLEKLQNNKIILIVEGEKTADKASELFSEYTVISWLGGSNNASKVNWNILEGKQIVIWPDNDVPGINAAKTIANKINIINSGMDSVSIIDVESRSLPSKWDLGDVMPIGMTIDSLRHIITESIQESHTLGFIKAKAEENRDEIEKRIIWQNRNSGFILPQKEIENELVRENKIYSKLSSEEAIDYIKYALAKKIIEPAHEFLDFHHELYRDSLIAISKSYDSKINLEKNIPDLIDDLQIEYTRKRDSFTGHSDYLQKNNEFSNILIRDILLLHQMQVSNAIDTKLCNLHKEMVAQNIYQIFGSYRNSKIENNDKIKIASEVYDQCCSSKWWQDLTEIRFDIRDRGMNLHKDFDMKKYCINHVANNFSREKIINFREEHNRLQIQHIHKIKSLEKDMD
jgi:ATP-dependent exoDNAse (exonuclease V) alpha subunit